MNTELTNEDREIMARGMLPPFQFCRLNVQYHDADRNDASIMLKAQDSRITSRLAQYDHDSGRYVQTINVR